MLLTTPLKQVRPMFLPMCNIMRINNFQGFQLLEVKRSQDSQHVYSWLQQLCCMCLCYVWAAHGLRGAALQATDVCCCMQS